jgi:Bacterial Ig-like domain
MHLRARLFPLLLLAAAGLPLYAQMNEYEARYGTATDVSLQDLAFNPEAYNDRAVRTHGRVEIAGIGGRYVLRESMTASVDIVPTAEVSGPFETAINQMVGRPIEITGVFNRYQVGSASGMQSIGQIAFWGFVGPPEEISKSARDKAKSYTLEALVTSAGRHEGELVKVVGQFRGRNLFGDLPGRSQKTSNDWVIKNDLYAVWVTGRKPKGTGFALDTGLKRDAGKWMEIVGRVETRGTIVYLQAVDVALASAPRAVQVTAPPPVKEIPKRAPEIVFSLPLDGERDVAPDGSFAVQFSKDMNAKSFEGHVRFRYADAARPGDHSFAGIRWAYDEGKRVLTVIPGDRLSPGRTIELLLLDGIVDDDALPLTPRPGRFFESAVEVLRWQARASS